MMVLREHLDSDICIEKDCANELPCDNKTRIGKKATGPDNIKGELYGALGESKICVKTLQKVFQNIIAKD